MKAFSSVCVVMILGLAALGGCSEDCECPTCPTPGLTAEWMAYDDFEDGSLNGNLWWYSIAFGGQVLETDGQLQVWGHTGGWTGVGQAGTMGESALGWRFELSEQYFEEGPGCQGWSIIATDPGATVRVTLLNRLTAGCGTAWNDEAGSYQIRHEDDSLAVYLDGSLVRRLHDGGIGMIKLEFNANNAYGSGHYSHIFIDDVERLDMDW